MAKKSNTAVPSDREDWEAHDGMHTLMRAAEIIANKPLLARVRKKAAEHADKMRAVADKAGQLAKRGLISDKAMAKIKGKSGQGGNVKALEKTAPIA